MWWIGEVFFGVKEERGFWEESSGRGGVAATFRPKGLFFGIYKFKFYPKTEFLNFHVFLCDLEK